MVDETFNVKISSVVCFGEHNSQRPSVALNCNDNNNMVNDEMITVIIVMKIMILMIKTTIRIIIRVSQRATIAHLRPSIS